MAPFHSNNNLIGNDIFKAKCLIKCCLAVVRNYPNREGQVLT